jgi:hypothetical protein
MAAALAAAVVGAATVLAVAALAAAVRAASGRRSSDGPDERERPENQREIFLHGDTLSGAPRLAVRARQERPARRASSARCPNPIYSPLTFSGLKPT